jgi:prepilin-type processing-associated H-X9-DG protein
LRIPNFKTVGSRPPWWGRSEQTELNLYGLTTDYPLVADTIDTAVSPNSQWYNFFAAEISVGPTIQIHARHLGLANIGYADGSVRAITPGQFDNPTLPTDQRFLVSTQK